jgi:predicted aspartyl protease
VIRYVYNKQHNPPAPFVHVTLRPPDGSKQLDDCPAQLDTAASRTVIPKRWADALGLHPFDQLPAEAVGGHVLHLRTVLIQVEIRQLQPLTIEAFSCEGEPYVLLGRDILNGYHIVLDGPQLALEMG